MEHKIFYFTRECTWLPGMEHGWGNGYVIIPKGHPWFEVDYKDLDDVDIHGGLTCSAYCKWIRGEWVDEDKDKWGIGFDVFDVTRGELREGYRLRAEERLVTHERLGAILGRSPPEERIIVS